MAKNILFCLLFVLSLTLNVVYCTFYIEYRKFHLIDKTPVLSNGFVNYLFRGNEPTISTPNGEEFSYEQLVDCLRNSSESQGITLPDDFYIIDIKLIYGVSSEIPVIELERNFFAANSSLGEFGTNVTLGDLWDPNFIPKSDRIEWAKNLTEWQKDNLPQRMEDYYNILNTPLDKPVVLFFHCLCGCDRTGEIAASYVMRYFGWDFITALDWDEKIAGRPIMPNNKWGAQWYCLYLKYSLNMDIDCDDI
ncbi:putative protein tyrosine phosphatase [Tieghemostelium lacteum]|uniref:Tyrosine specific protein phosphatases domain-containing protein n=1 Tax=Tieghemostelium lacteum TaxID=361077 RepID=A0A152A4V2_TIELA|nr:putative protein tyrosine phosphatase [Tieghemostelium lacteum]|eukprot:KYR01244.1 putative protein tyrosine phosphatase [Tieghemostelium lacteum]